MKSVSICLLCVCFLFIGASQSFAFTDKEVHEIITKVHLQDKFKVISWTYGAYFSMFGTLKIVAEFPNGNIKMVILKQKKGIFYGWYPWFVYSIGDG